MVTLPTRLLRQILYKIYDIVIVYFLGIFYVVKANRYCNRLSYAPGNILNMKTDTKFFTRLYNSKDQLWTLIMDNGHN
jgi:sulfur transfer complex TusBCD TusB component (DsrH family)